MIPVLHGVWASGGGLITDAFEHIETQTIGSGGASSVTFSNIAGTYKHLQIRGMARTDRTQFAFDNISIRFNSDTGSNYAYHLLNGNGSAASSSAGTTLTRIEFISSSTTNVDPSNMFSAFVIDLLDYTSTSKNKTLRALRGVELNAAYGAASESGVAGLQSGLWINSSNAISSITFAPIHGTNFVQNSVFALYGVK